MTCKRISIKEFREAGYLQELNRRFLHPLGLSLELTVDEKDEVVKFAGVLDKRRDPVGFLYDEKFLEEHAKIFFHRANAIEQERQQKILARKKKFGWAVQPLNIDPNK